MFYFIHIILNIFSLTFVKFKLPNERFRLLKSIKLVHKENEIELTWPRDLTRLAVLLRQIYGGQRRERDGGRGRRWRHGGAHAAHAPAPRRPARATHRRYHQAAVWGQEIRCFISLCFTILVFESGFQRIIPVGNIYTGCLKTQRRSETGWMTKW